MCIRDRMNTRLGSDNGILLAARVVFLLLGHQYSDHWIANRTLIKSGADQAAKGFSIISASDDRINDFHSCNLAFSWS